MRLAALLSAGLVVSFATAAQASVIVDRPAQADAYNQQLAANADLNFGDATILNSRWVEGSVSGRNTYIRFDVSSLPLPVITDATFSITFAAYSGTSTHTHTTFKFYGLALNHAGNAWVEGTGQSNQGPVTPPAEITWNNAPANDLAGFGNTLIWSETYGNGAVLGSIDVPQTGLSAGNVLSFSAGPGSAMVNFLNDAAASGHQTATLIMLADTDSGFQIRFRSREAVSGAAPPRLEMTVVPEPALSLLAVGGVMLLRSPRRRRP